MSTKSVTRAHKFRLYPNKLQLRQLRHYSAVAKFTWNWGVRTAREDHESELRELGYLPEKPELKTKSDRRAWRDEVREARKKARADEVKLTNTYYWGYLEHRFEAVRSDPEFGWLLRGHSHTYGRPIFKRIQKAQKDHIDWLAAGGPKSSLPKKGPPRFKPKWSRCSFTIQYNPKKLVHGRLALPQPQRDGKLPKDQRKIRCRPDPLLEIDPGAAIKSITVKPVADWWEATITVECDRTSLPPGEKTVVGVDLGLNSIVTMADEAGIEALEPPRYLAKNLKKLKRLQRAHDRKQKGSKRHWQSRMKVAKLHAKVANQRYDFLQKLSHHLVKNYDTIAVEGFNIHRLVEKGVKGTNKKKANVRRSMLDMSWGELRRQLNYKSDWNAREFIVPGVFDPTDMMCCECGYLNKMPPDTSAYSCSSCGAKRTRQENTALLLKSFGEGNLPESTPGDGGTNGRGVGGSVLGHPSTKKRETSSL